MTRIMFPNNMWRFYFMNKPNILHVSSNVFPPLSVDHSTKKIWFELSKAANQYHILARSKNHKYQVFTEGNITLHLVPNLGNAKTFFFTSFKMKKLIKKHQINIVLAQCPILGGFTAAVIKKRLSIKIFQEIHDTFYFDLVNSNNPFKRLAYFLFKYSLKKADRIRALNDLMANKINYKNKVITIENRVNMSLFKPKQNNQFSHPINIISVGSFVKRKGFHILIDSVRELSKEYDIHLILIGGGKEYNNLKSQSQDLNVTLYDRLDQSEINRLLLESDIYVQPSLREGMPRTILEAMASKLPVVASNISLIPGTVKHLETGLLIEPFNHKEITLAISLLINDEDLRNRLVKNAYEMVMNKYEWNYSFEKYRTALINTVN